MGRKRHGAKPHERSLPDSLDEMLMPRGMIGVITDITDKNNLREQLRHAQKMHSIAINPIAGMRGR